MKYFKYSILILLWLLIKPLSILISISIIGLWIYLLGLDTWWSYLLAFSPTIIIYGFMTFDWVKCQFNKKSYHGTTGFEDVAGMLLVILSLIPCMLISLLIMMICFTGVKFPSKYDIKNLEKESISKTFIHLFDFI